MIYYRRTIILIHQWQIILVDSILKNFRIVFRASKKKNEALQARKRIFEIYLIRIGFIFPISLIISFTWYQKLCLTGKQSEFVLGILHESDNNNEITPGNISVIKEMMLANIHQQEVLSKMMGESDSQRLAVIGKYIGMTFA